MKPGTLLQIKDFILALGFQNKDHFIAFHYRPNVTTSLKVERIKSKEIVMFLKQFHYERESFAEVLYKNKKIYVRNIEMEEIKR